MLNTDIAYVAQFFHSLREKTEHLNVSELLFESLQFGITDDVIELY